MLLSLLLIGVLFFFRSLFGSGSSSTVGGREADGGVALFRFGPVCSLWWAFRSLGE